MSYVGDNSRICVSFSALPICNREDVHKWSMHYIFVYCFKQSSFKAPYSTQPCMEVKNIHVEDQKIQDAEDTYSIMRKIFFERHQEADFLKEHFWTIALNRALKIVAIELVSIGNNGSTIATPQEILRIPLYKGASQLVLVHNHPSGNLKPSTRDLDTTNRLIQAALLMDIDIVDHVIVTEKSYYSFCDNDLIEKLRWDNKYALTFIREKQIKKTM